MLRSPLVPAAVAAGLALVLPALAGVVPLFSPTTPPPVPAVAALTVVGVAAAVLVVAGAGWDGHRRAVHALRAGALTADAGVSLATLPALAWSVPALLVPAAVSGPDAAPGPLTLLGGPALLPGTAAVLTVVAIVVQRTGRDPRGAGTTREWVRPGGRRNPGQDALGAAADRWSARIVPAAALAALAVTGFHVGAGAGWTTAVPAGVAVLLAACPVALLAAVPAAVRAADRAGGPDVRLPLPAPGGTGHQAGPGPLPHRGRPVAGARADGGRAGHEPAVARRYAPAAPAGPAVPRAGHRPAVPASAGVPARFDPVGWTDPTGGPRPAQRVDTVALAGPDVLTGTAPGSVAVHPARGEDPATVLRLAGSVAAAARPGSDLAPLARALAEAAPGELPEVAEADEQPGLGMSGLVAELVAAAPRPDGRADGDTATAGTAVGVTDRTRATIVAHAVLLGSPDWLLEHGIRLPAGIAADRERAEAHGRAVVAVAWDGAARAVLALTRAPHPDAAAGVAALRAAGIEPVFLSPDEDGAARALAAAAGLDPADPDAVRPGLDAAGRAAAVAGLRVRGRTVAVAAEPGSDAAALAGADLAIRLVPHGSVPHGSVPSPAPATATAPASTPASATATATATAPNASADPVDPVDPVVPVHPADPGTPDDPVAPVPVAPTGSARIVVRGGPAEVAVALVLARRARAHARTGVLGALGSAALATVAAVAGAPGPLVAAVPVLAAVALRARRL